MSTSRVLKIAKPIILDRPLNKTKNEGVSLSAMAFLLSEMLQYTQKRVSGIEELEKRLASFGYRVGIRELELILFRDRSLKRETRLLQILLFINTGFWKSLFGKAADALEKGTDHEDEYMLHENEPILSRFISVPKEMSSLNCMAFTAGMVEAVLDASGFPARVSAHSTGDAQWPNRATLLIKFDKTVMARERFLS